METLKDMAERLRSVGGKSMCLGSEIMGILGDTNRGCPTSEDGRGITCEACRILMRGKLADALEAARELPDGVKWPRFEDGELVRFGDVFEDEDGVVERMTGVDFYEGRVVVWGLGKTAEETARADSMTVKRPTYKSDTMKAIDADAAKDPCAYFNGRTPDKCADCKLHEGDADFDFDVRFAECRTAMARDLLARQRKLMGGE